MKDEPLAQFDDVCTKVDALVDVINRQNGFLQQIAKDGGYNTEYKFLCNEFNVRQTLENALDEYLEKNRKKMVSVDEEDTKLTKAKTLLEEYRTTLNDAVDAAGKGHSDETPPTTVVIHEAAPSYIDVPQHLEAPNTYKGLLVYLFFRMPWYHVRKFFSSRHVRWMYRTILFSVWLISICRPASSPTTMPNCTPSRRNMCCCVSLPDPTRNGQRKQTTSSSCTLMKRSIRKRYTGFGRTGASDLNADKSVFKR